MITWFKFKINDERTQRRQSKEALQRQFDYILHAQSPSPGVTYRQSFRLHNMMCMYCTICMYVWHFLCACGASNKILKKRGEEEKERKERRRGEKERRREKGGEKRTIDK